MLLEPLVTPTNCPIHPVRMVLEWSSKAGLPLPTFRTGPCKEEGCVSVDCVVEHPTTGERLLVLGQCVPLPLMIEFGSRIGSNRFFIYLCTFELHGVFFPFLSSFLLALSAGPHSSASPAPLALGGFCPFF